MLAVLRAPEMQHLEVARDREIRHQLQVFRGGRRRLLRAAQLGIGRGDPAVADIAKRRYITVGVTGFLLLLPLAITSTQGWIRHLGRRWALLHRAVYLAAVCGVVHLLWIVKGDDLREPAAYGTVLAILMAVRAYYWLR